MEKTKRNFNGSLMKFKNKILLFLFFGITSVLIDLIFFNLFFFLAKNFLLSRILGILIASIYNFSMNRNLTFCSKNRCIKSQISKYIIVYITSNSINLLTSMLIVNLFGESILIVNIAAVTGIIVSVPIGFFGSLLWVFKNKES